MTTKRQLTDLNRELNISFQLRHVVHIPVPVVVIILVKRVVQQQERVSFGGSYVATKREHEKNNMEFHLNLDELGNVEFECYSKIYKRNTAVN